MITPRPISASDRIDQSRDTTGLHKWAQSSRAVGFIMFILGWFTIPAEVLLRKDFGQRWFTRTNFYAGFFLLLVFASVEYAIVAVKEAAQHFIADFASSVNPLYTPDEPAYADRLTDNSMQIFLLLYFYMGSFHLFKIWWRNRTNNALHSFSDGKSRLTWIVNLTVTLANAMAVPWIGFYMLLLPRKLWTSLFKLPKLIKDRAAFTNTVAEPLFILFLAVMLHGIASLWLFITAVAVAIHASWKETAKLNKILDFRDSMIDAKEMSQLRAETMETTNETLILQQAAATLKEYPQIIPPVAMKYPDLIHIIEEMNRDGSHLNS